MELTQALKILQADVFKTYLQVHGYHWNVEGILFPEMHEKWLEVYEDIYGSIDDISEMLRKLGERAPMTLEDIQANSSFSTVYSGSSAKDQIEAFLASNEMVISSIKAAHDLADKAGEIGIASDLEIRDSMHKKWRWQLGSTIKTTIA
jgi:starvation-inducible DNA-binding protein